MCINKSKNVQTEYKAKACFQALLRCSRFSRRSLKLTPQPSDCECKGRYFFLMKTIKKMVSPDRFAVGNSRENYVENLVFTGVSVKGRKWSEENSLSHQHQQTIPF